MSSSSRTDMTGDSILAPAGFSCDADTETDSAPYRPPLTLQAPAGRGNQTDDIKNCFNLYQSETYGNFLPLRRNQNYIFGH